MTNRAEEVPRVRGCEAGEGLESIPGSALDEVDPEEGEGKVWRRHVD